MAITHALLTLEDLERIPDDGMHRELIEGELIELPPPKSKHPLLAKRILLLLEQQLKAQGTALIEAGYKVQRDNRTWIQPDVSVCSEEMVHGTHPDEYFEGSPVLAVEIISPSERAQDVLRKAELTITGGAKEVWIVYPVTKEVVVYSETGASRPLSTGDTLSSSLGFEIRVEKFFQS